MKQSEVPQDQLAYYGDARRAVYAVDDSGHYTTVASTGWSAEAQVNADAVAEFERLAQEARTRVEQGRSSPLDYHMYARRMDLPMLAQSSGIWRWRVRRHLRPQVFQRLPERLLARYAEALGLSIAALKELP
ncbi:hypothetical protein E4T66_08875 [Sinimarinibacterium sp. CAU 1509]|uniref:hypothetical protein n=1 Tax=Sinimarinibacterium sp. CAU 1509 TaxID=2562283 RepID=UPI0010AD97A0|nr:hypothetical protein [Sinimarinibacterium sp. CAU 1509]TJY62318.1 hypothetical protein E4T66_08875 [Sinimarinibacterium sp. CAU 1509]